MMKASYILLVGFLVLLDFTHAQDSIVEMANKAIHDNIRQVGSTKFIVAGKNQFSSLWTRDFAYSVPGLLQSGQQQLVKDQLDLIFRFALKKDDVLILPRAIDSMSPVFRTLSYVLFKKRWPIKDKLKAEYKGEHGNYAIDSNILVLKAAIQYVHFSGDIAWWKNNLSNFKKIINFYESYLDDRGLIKGECYGDWQDSVCRKDASFLTNFHYWWVGFESNKLSFPLIAQERLNYLKQKLYEVFYSDRKKLFYSLDNGPQVSLDGNLFAVESFDFITSKQQRMNVYNQLKKSKLWLGAGPLPGLATYPNYPLNQISYSTRLAGLRHYHDNMIWTWLIGKSLHLSAIMKDWSEYYRIQINLKRLLQVQGTVFEVLEPRSLKPVSRFFYKSEGPFTWGASMIIEGASNYLIKN